MEHLIHKIKNSDHRAFLEIYRLLHKKVYHFFIKRVKLSEAAEELTQDCFIKLWQYRESLSQEYTLEKQVFTISYSLLINFLKKEAGTQKNKVEYLRNAGQEEGHAEEHNKFETRDQFNNAIASLSPAGKQVVFMKIAQGYSNKEIAGKLSVSPKTVEGHVTRALKTLRKVISCAISIL